MTRESWKDILGGRSPALPVGPRAAEPPRELIFPGAFNPLHDGHRAMARHARQIVGRPLALELSIENVDKRALSEDQLAVRLAGLTEWTVWLTRAATFAEKAALFPGATFVVGADTVARIGDSTYYEGDVARRDAALGAIAEAGCQFVVFGRHWDGVFRTLGSLELPGPLRTLCRGVAEDVFRDDTSSTGLRSPGGGSVSNGRPRP